MTEEEIESQVQQDFDAVLGKVIMVRELDGYIGDESVTLHFNQPIPVKVTGGNLMRWMDDGDDAVIDPYWDVEIVGQPHLGLPAGTDFTSPWIYGTSRYVNGRTEPARCRFETIREKVRRFTTSGVNRLWRHKPVSDPRID